MVQQEFESIATDLRQRLIAVARGYRLGMDSAQDVAQDTLLKLWTVRERIDSRKSATALAVTIARHLSVDALRRVKTSDIDKVSPADSKYRQPDAVVECLEDEHWLGIQLNRLPSKEYAVLHLRQVEKKSTEEIAAIVGISPKSVPTLLARARKKLMEEIKRR